jgi:UDP-N-acetylglucosamine:LPS N-acetylglucosamine transferase
MRICFVGGGTGGHFYPLIAVAEVLKDTQPDAELYYIGPAPFDKNSRLLSSREVASIFFYSKFL